MEFAIEHIHHCYTILITTNNKRKMWDPWGKYTWSCYLSFTDTCVHPHHHHHPWTDTRHTYAYNQNINVKDLDTNENIVKNSFGFHFVLSRTCACENSPKPQPWSQVHMMSGYLGITWRLDHFTLGQTVLPVLAKLVLCTVFVFRVSYGTGNMQSQGFITSYKSFPGMNAVRW